MKQFLIYGRMAVQIIILMLQLRVFTGSTQLINAALQQMK